MEAAPPTKSRTTLSISFQLKSANLSASGGRQAQQLVAEVSDLTAGPHTINIINRSPESVAVDAIVVKA